METKIKKLTGDKAGNTQSKGINIKEDAIKVIKTVILLQRNYGIAYLCRILTGVNFREWKNQDHLKLETFGSMEDKPWFQVRNLIIYLANVGLLRVTTRQFSVVIVTDAGMKFLDDAKDLVISPSELKNSKFEYLMERKLKEFRRNTAEKFGKEPFEIFADYTIDCIVRQKPQNLTELLEIPGIGEVKAEKYGAGILTIVARYLDLQEKEYLNRLGRLVKSETYQETLKMFLAGKKPAEIAKARSLAETTIRGHLFNLHRAGEVDLKPWIEGEVDGKALYRGAEFFKSTSKPRLKEAYETLGLDYETLRLCKLYVSDYSSKIEDLAA